MFRRSYCPSFIQRHQSAAVTCVERYRKCVDPTAIDKDGRNAVHLSVLLALHDPVLDNGTAAEAALEQVLHFLLCNLIKIGAVLCKCIAEIKNNSDVTMSLCVIRYDYDTIITKHRDYQ